MSEFIVATRLLLGIVFALSSSMKLHTMKGFVDVVSTLCRLGGRSSKFVAAAVILIEAGVAISLMTGIGSMLGTLVAVLLLGVFTLVMVRNTRSESPLPCYCFGAGDSVAHPIRSLFRLLLLVACALFVILGWASLGRAVLERAPDFNEIALAVALLIVGLWLLQLNELLELHRTRIPKFVNIGDRISLRHVPIGPPSDGAERVVR